MTKVTAWHHLSTASRIAALEQAAHEGLSVAQIAKRHDTTASRVWGVVGYYRREKGIDLKLAKGNRGAAKNVDRAAALVTLSQAGFTPAQIAAAFGIRVTSVRNLAIRIGFSLKGAA